MVVTQEMIPNFGSEPLGKQLLVRPEGKWKANIKTTRKEVILIEFNWLRIERWRGIVNTIMNIRVLLVTDLT